MVKFALQLELIQKQNGHEVQDFVKQIEVAYQKLNSDAMVSKYSK